MTPGIAGDAERLGHERRHGLRVDADLASPHPAGFSDLREHIAHDVAGRGESNALVPAALAVDQRVDADQPAVRVDQRPAAVPGLIGASVWT